VKVTGLPEPGVRATAPSNFVPAHGVSFVIPAGAASADTVRRVPKSTTSCADDESGSPEAARTVAIPPTVVVPGAVAPTRRTARVTTAPSGTTRLVTTSPLEAATSVSEIVGR
jgi:hypothetical protein